MALEISTKNADLAARIRDARGKLAMTQEEFAAALGVSPRAVYYWEAGKARPQIKNIVLICATAGVSLIWLLNGTAERDLAAFEFAAERLDREQRQRVAEGVAEFIADPPLPLDEALTDALND